MGAVSHIFIFLICYNIKSVSKLQKSLGAERELQRLRGVLGQDDATETGRRATPQRIVDIVRNRTLK